MKLLEMKTVQTEMQSIMIDPTEQDERPFGVDEEPCYEAVVE